MVDVVALDTNTGAILGYMSIYTTFVTLVVFVFIPICYGVYNANESFGNIFT
jgi:hypothetical protein